MTDITRSLVGHKHTSGDVRGGKWPDSMIPDTVLRVADLGTQVEDAIADDLADPASGLRVALDSKIPSFAPPGGDRLVLWDESAGEYVPGQMTSGLYTSGTSVGVRDATDAQTGLVELATSAEVATGTDATRAVTPATLKPLLDAKVTGFADPNADRILFWDDSAGAYAALRPWTGLAVSGTDLTVRTGSESLTGMLELATAAETATGTDTTRAVHPAGLKPLLDAKLPGTTDTSPNGVRILTSGDLAHESEVGHTTELDFSQYGYGIGPVIHGRRAEGTKAAKTAPVATQLLWGIGSRPWTGSDWTEHSTAALHWIAEENISATNQGTRLRLLVTPVGTTWASRIAAIDINPDGTLDRIAVPTVQVYKTAAGGQSLTTATYAPVTFESEAWDNRSMHSTVSNTSRLVAPVAGKYRVSATITFTANTSGARAINFRVNGSTTQRYGTISVPASTGGLATQLSTSTELDLAAGDYVEVWAYQNSGGDLTLPPETTQAGVQRFAMSYYSA